MPLRFITCRRYQVVAVHGVAVRHSRRPRRRGSERRARGGGHAPHGAIRPARAHQAGRACGRWRAGRLRIQHFEPDIFTREGRLLQKRHRTRCGLKVAGVVDAVRHCSRTRGRRRVQRTGRRGGAPGGAVGPGRA